MIEATIMKRYIKSAVNLDDIPEENKGGNCFQVAAETVESHPSYKLVHAVVSGQGPLKGIKYLHAFALDESRGVVIDNTQKNPALREMIAGLYWYIGKIELYREYSYEQMLNNLVKFQTWGPWDKVFNGYM